jgi:nitric oxide reductase NorQ protein
MSEVRLMERGQIDGKSRVSANTAPFYSASGNEIQAFEAAWRSKVAVMLKGPTGCGKTRLVEHMAHRVGVPLFTVSCHEDMTASDLLGRYTLAGGDTVWVDGPLTRAAREGGICYLDEVVEARQDTIVAIHSLTDHRRELNIERLGGESFEAADGFMLVVSYNPGYQSVLKDLKMSTRQRMFSIELDFPSAELERKIVVAESGVSEKVADSIVRLGLSVRRAGQGQLKEVSSTRTLVTAGKMMRAGMSFKDAAVGAMAGPLTDDEEAAAGLVALIEAYANGD